MNDGRCTLYSRAGGMCSQDRAPVGVYQREHPPESRPSMTRIPEPDLKPSYRPSLYDVHECEERVNPYAMPSTCPRTPELNRSSGLWLRSTGIDL
jgi:hypothetical protein